MAAQITPRTLVEAFLPLVDEVSLAEVYDAANLAGLDDQPVRLAIRRLIAAGDAVQRGRGRAGELRLTDEGRGRLQRDRQSLALAFAQDAGEAAWDGRWHLVAVSAPESDRRIRDGLRRELIGLGAVAVSTGLYVGPHDLREVLPAEIAPYITTAATSDLSVQGVRDPLVIAETLWPQAPIIDAYAHLDETLQRDAGDETLPNVVAQLVLAEALERAMRHDPLVPLELRSRPWHPSGVRDEWLRRWEALDDDSGATIYAGWWPPSSPGRFQG